MDFSKIKKIFYIVAIISMLLSIKSKVFGATYEYTFADSNDSVSLFPVSDYYVYCIGKKNGTNSYNFHLIVCDTAFTISQSQAYIYLPSGCKAWWIGYTNATLLTITNKVEEFTASKLDTLSNGYTVNSYVSYTASGSTVFTNFDLKYYGSDEIFNSNSVTQNPFFANPEELEDAPENVFIELGDYSANDYLYFHLLEVTNIMPMSNNDSTYYYNDHAFALNKDSKYYTQLLDTTKYYYEIPRSALGLNPNTSYFYVLTSSSTQIDNSINPITEGDDIFDVIMQDTSGIISEDMATNDKLQNINQEFRDYQQQQEEFQNQNSITPETETDISNNLNFNSSTPQFSNLFNSYFSRLTSLIADLGNYQDSAVLTINLPVPHTNSSIPIRSDIFSSHVPADIYFIIQMFWLFIFGKYYLKFLLKIYHLASTGLLLDYYSLSGEIITQDML